MQKYEQELKSAESDLKFVNSKLVVLEPGTAEHDKWLLRKKLLETSIKFYRKKLNEN